MMHHWHGARFVVCLVIWVMFSSVSLVSARPSKVGLTDIKLLKKLGYTDRQLIQWMRKHRLNGTFRLQPAHVLRLHKQGFSIALLRHMGVVAERPNLPAGRTPALVPLRRKANTPQQRPLRLWPKARMRQKGAQTPPNTSSLPFNTRIMRHFVLSMPLPLRWKKTRSQLPHILQYQIPIRLPRRAYPRYKVIVEVMLGEDKSPAQRQERLRKWLVQRLFPDAVVTYIGRLFQRRRRKKRYSFRVHSHRNWASTNARGSSTLVHVINRHGRFHGRLGAHAVSIQGITLLIGVELSLQARYLSAARYRQLKLDFVRLVTRGIPRLFGHVRVAPYQVREEPLQRLIRKGRYRYVFQRNLSLAGGYGATSFSSQRSITWRFGRDGTCRCKHKGFSGVFSSFTDGAGRHSGTGSATRKRRHSPGIGGCQTLLVPGQGLWLALRLPDGNSQIHRLEFTRRGKYGPFAYQGLAIDGIVEGRYSRGNNYKVYKAW